VGLFEEMKRPSLSDSWAWELISMCFCVVCCIALLAVLGHFDGHDTPQLPHRISLNTIAAILATAAKASLLTAVAAAMGQNKWLKLRRDKAEGLTSDIQLFDSASRGPLGAFMLLYHCRRGRLVALLGAIVLVTSIGFEPFAQQAISYPLRVVYISLNSSQMPISREFQDPGDMSLYPYQHSHIADSSLLDFALGNGSVPQVLPTCSTGNCTWGSYTSLALCSSCTDVSDYARRNIHCGLVNLAETDFFTCNYTLTDGMIAFWTSETLDDLALMSQAVGAYSSYSQEFRTHTNGTVTTDWAAGKLFRA
jgi:hypothetical protein